MDAELTPDPMSAHPAGSARRAPTHRVRNLVIGGAAAAGLLAEPPASPVRPRRATPPRPRLPPPRRRPTAPGPTRPR